jgi:hypothetical protein
MKNLNVLFFVMIALALMMSCGSSPKQQQQQEPSNTIPAWVAELPPENAFWGIGIAKLQNDSLAMQTAASRARRDVAEQISIQVQGMLTDYARESGLADSSRSIQSIENIGRDLININLSGAVPNARERVQDGTWWVRVEVSKDNVKKDVNSIINHEMAAFAEFEADRAIRLLDAQLDKFQSKPTPRSED